MVLLDHLQGAAALLGSGTEGSLESLMWAQQFAHHVERAVHHLREPAPGDES